MDLEAGNGQSSSVVAEGNNTLLLRWATKGGGRLSGAGGSKEGPTASRLRLDAKSLETKRNALLSRLEGSFLLQRSMREKGCVSVCRVEVTTIVTALLVGGGRIYQDALQPIQSGLKETGKGDDPPGNS